MSRKKYQHKAPNAKQIQWATFPVKAAESAKIVMHPKQHHPALNMEKFNALKSTEPRMAAQRVPDGVYPIIAWRAWGLTTNANGWLLSGLGVSEAWTPRKAMAAKCIQDTLAISLWLGVHKTKHLAPHRDCSCGVWAFRSSEELLSALKDYRDVKVIGQVYLWGRILECENGFRAQYAYPCELWLLDESLEELGWVYGVPIRTAPAAPPR